MRKTIVLALTLLLAFPVFSFAAADGPHWVDPELASYKQRIVKFKDGSSTMGSVTREEWRSFQSTVLDARKLDEPIEMYHWATMLKMGVELPKGQEDKLIEAYVYGLAPMNAKNINRETAIGGLIKLLSFTIVRANWSNTEADAAKAFADFGTISDMQSGLVRIAYRDGLLDSATKDKFRPKDYLTNAEAISVMEKVMRKYEEAPPQIALPHDHWAYAEASSLLSKHRFSVAQQKRIQDGLQTDDVVPVPLWHELLASLLGFSAGKDSREAQYTYGLAHGEFLGRDRAIAGLMKLWGPSRDATDDEKKAAAEAFRDYRDAFDQSKLAIAYKLGVVQGYGETFHPERGLTYSEMLVLLSRIAGKGSGNGSGGSIAK